MGKILKPEKRVHVKVGGKVQGVGFRYLCQSSAQRFGVKGWVRNLPDGNVELEAQGGADVLQKFLQEIRTGHTVARVETFRIQDIPTEETGDEFEIRY